MNVKNQVNNNKINNSKNTNNTKDINNIDNSNFFINFNIKLKDYIHTIKEHGKGIICSTLLKDGRLATGFVDNSIIIFNKKTYKPELTIKEHNNSVYYLIQLTYGILVSCSLGYTIKLFDITDKEYKVIQHLDYHKQEVY